MAIRYELNADKMMSAIISLPEPDKTVTDVQLILSNEKELVIGTKKSHILYDKDGQIRVKTEKSTEVMAKTLRSAIINCLCLLEKFVDYFCRWN